MPLPCDQVLQWMFQHAPPGYRCLSESQLAALRASKPERVLYPLRTHFVKPDQHGIFAALIRRFWASRRHYACGVAPASGAAIGSAPASS